MGSYKDKSESYSTTLGTSARGQILKACAAGRNSLEDATHPAHGHFDQIAKAVGGEWSESSSTNIRNQDLSSPLPSFERPNRSDIQQTSTAAEGSHYSPVGGADKSAFRKADTSAKSTTSELITRIESLAVKAAGAKDDALVQQLVELKEILKTRSQNEMSDEDWQKYGTGDRGAVAKAQRRTANRWQPMPPHFSGGRRSSGGRRTFVERHAG